mmetsp:Transcript_10642/g.28403  ORF Transcript_10642/g.28403 Transcript_10642/m.28403 type:complete len:281 (-) Transcript_10642:50-892(-)
MLGAAVSVFLATRCHCESVFVLWSGWHTSPSAYSTLSSTASDETTCGLPVSPLCVVPRPSLCLIERGSSASSRAAVERSTGVRNHSPWRLNVAAFLLRRLFGRRFARACATVEAGRSSCATKRCISSIPSKNQRCDSMVVCVVSTTLNFRSACDQTFCCTRIACSGSWTRSTAWRKARSVSSSSIPLSSCPMNTLNTSFRSFLPRDFLLLSISIKNAPPESTRCFEKSCAVAHTLTGSCASSNPSRSLRRAAPSPLMLYFFFDLCLAGVRIRSLVLMMLI